MNTVLQYILLGIILVVIISIIVYILYTSEISIYEFEDERYPVLDENKYSLFKDEYLFEDERYLYLNEN